MFEGDDEQELARAVARRKWNCSDAVSAVHIGGEGRRTWRVGREMWLTASHDTRALGSENDLLTHLGFVSGARLRVPELITNVDGELLTLAAGFGWRVTRHIRGRRPDDELADTYRESVRALRSLHRTLKDVPEDYRVVEPLDGTCRRLLDLAFDSEWANVTDDLSERNDVLNSAGWLEPRLLRLSALPRQLIHGDWSTPNLLIEEDGPARIVAALDWQFASVGPVVWDLAQVVSGVLMWSSLPEKPAFVRELCDLYGDAVDSRDLGVAMVAYWFCNYWRCREELAREPRSRAGMNRQPGRLRSVLDFASRWDS